MITHYTSCQQCRTVSTVSTVIARCYLHLRWYFLLKIFVTYFEPLLQIILWLWKGSLWSYDWWQLGPWDPILGSYRRWGERFASPELSRSSNPLTLSWVFEVCRVTSAVFCQYFPSDYKVNRCLARYSPRATTTNRPTSRAPNKPAWPGPNLPKMPILGQIWSFWGKKS